MAVNFARWLRRRRIAVLMGGRSGERAISLKTGDAIYRSLRRQKFSVVAIDTAGDLVKRLKKHRIDFAYIALHGPGGEDGVIQGFLQQLGIPFTGAGVLGSALAMDKAVAKALFQTAGLAISPGFIVFRKDRSEASKKVRSLGFPVVVKPADQGSALGVTIVRRASEWESALRKSFKVSDTALVERFLDGPEITIGVLGGQALPIIEIVPSDRPFYDFHAKYAPGGSRHILPARITARAARQSTDLALRACRLLGTTSVARVDLIIDRRQGPTLLEVNTIPGMTETSLLPEAAKAVGIDFDALVLKIAECSTHEPEN